MVQISQLTIMRHAMPDRVRGRALALVGGTVRVAGVTAPLLGGLLVDAAGYRAVPACYAGLLLAACGFFVALGPRRQVEAEIGVERWLTAVDRVLRQNWRVLLPAGGTFVVLSVLRASRRVVLPLWGYEMGLSPTAIGMVISTGAVADTILFPLGGLMSDTRGRRWSLTACLGLLSLGLMALAPFGGSVAGFVAVAVLIGIGNGFGSGINMTVGTDLAPRGGDTSRFLGIWRVITDTGGTLGPVAVGVLSEFLALGPAALIIGLSGIGGVTLMWRFMPETRGLRDATPL
jgi:MFS family permease